MELPVDSYRRITTSLVESVKLYFRSPSFEFDEGSLKQIDSDDSGVFLGLFPYDEDTGEPERTHIATWYIEVGTQEDGVNP
jgi:hypothetical protein